MTIVTNSGTMKRKFDAFDRCDRCGAQARCYALSVTSNNELLFCGHHYREHRDALESSGWILDVEPL